MRLVGLLFAGLGGFVVWEVFTGKRPQDHIQQLIDLFGHQHTSSAPAAPAVPGGGSSGAFTP